MLDIIQLSTSMATLLLACTMSLDARNDLLPPTRTRLLLAFLETGPWRADDRYGVDEREHTHALVVSNADVGASLRGERLLCDQNETRNQAREQAARCCTSSSSSTPSALR